MGPRTAGRHPRFAAHLRAACEIRSSRRAVSGANRADPATAGTSNLETSSRTARAINRLRLVDHALDAASANVAAAIADELAVSVADAHLGAVIRSLPHDEVVVLTSDPEDIARVAGDRPVRAARV